MSVEPGYLLLRAFFADAELAPFQRCLETFVDDLAAAYAERGLVRDRCAGEGFETRLARLLDQAPEMAFEFNREHVVRSRVLERHGLATKPAATFEPLVGPDGLVGPELFALMTHPGILDIAETFVGSEVHCQGRHRLRPKVRGVAAGDFAWHEDTLVRAASRFFVATEPLSNPPGWQPELLVHRAILDAPSEPTIVIALVDVTEENGCIHVARGGHVVTREVLSTIVPVPMKRGDVLVMHQHLPHMSFSNRTDRVRWTLDLRYQSGNHPPKSLLEPGFLARSASRPHDVVTSAAQYRRIIDSVAAFRREHPFIRF